MAITKYTVFYDKTTKEIIGNYNGETVDAVAAAWYTSMNCDSIVVETEETPNDNFYVNDDLGGITARHNMGITKNKDYCAVDEVITFSNVPENCAIVIDKEHEYTMDNSGSLTITALQAGSYYITFTHSESRKYFWQGFTFYVTGLTV